MTPITRRSFVTAAAATCLVLASGCSGSSEGTQTATGSAASSAVGNVPIVVGTLATEDILPLWVAQQENLFAENDLEVEIVTFQSATELIAGVASGNVDLAMTDIMVAASIYASGTDIALEWVTLGTTLDQGRFGIMVGPDSTVTSLRDLADVPIGVGSNTILEYVMDSLMQNAGVPDDQIVVEELQKLPVRYQTMLEGEVEAAALPGTLLALGEANGCRLIADDTQGDNISQSVMIARTEYATEDSNRQRIERLEETWDEAAALINTNPEDYRTTLVTNANLPEAIADTYPISEYPSCELPTAAMVTPVLTWMQSKGYLTTPLSYDPSTGTFAK